MGVKMPDSDRAKPFQSVLLSGGSTKRLESSRKSSRMLALMSPAWAPSAALGVGRMEEKTLGHGLKEKILNSAAVKKGKAKGKEKERQRSGGVVSTGQPGRAIKTEEDGFAQAAILLCHADHLLIAAGAGFSADSGLPVYKVGTRSFFALHLVVMELSCSTHRPGSARPLEAIQSSLNCKWYSIIHNFVLVPSCA